MPVVTNAARRSGNKRLPGAAAGLGTSRHLTNEGGEFFKFGSAFYKRFRPPIVIQPSFLEPQSRRFGVISHADLNLVLDAINGWVKLHVSLLDAFKANLRATKAPLDHLAYRCEPIGLVHFALPMSA